MATCSLCSDPLDTDDPTIYHEVKSWVTGPKLDGPVLRERTGVLAHRHCIDNLVRGQAPDQPGLFDEEVPTRHTHGEGPCPDCPHTYRGMGGNRSAECKCEFSPHRDWCPAKRD